MPKDGDVRYDPASRSQLVFRSGRWLESAQPDPRWSGGLFHFPNAQAQQSSLTPLLTGRVRPEQPIDFERLGLRLREEPEIGAADQGAGRAAAEPSRVPLETLRLSEAGRDLIRRNEGYRLDVYPDTGGVLTVGVGHRVRPEDHFNQGDRLTDAQVEAIFDEDIRHHETALRNQFSGLQLTQNEYDAMVDLAFNIGGGEALGSRKSPRLNAAIQSRDYNAMAGELRYTKDASGKSPKGLALRSSRREHLFRYGEYLK